MARNTKRIGVRRFVDIAGRRAGGSYSDAAFAVMDRLLKLMQEFSEAPPSYRGYLAVGVCSCMESHMKYRYAAAVEVYDDHPEVLRVLLNELDVDVETLVSLNSHLFSLADVVAASITVSSFAQYRQRASHFFQVFAGAPHDFPWDYARAHATGGAPDEDKKYAAKLDRLERMFEIRHRFVHETEISASPKLDIAETELLDCADDAFRLMDQFEDQFEQIGMDSRFALPKEGATIEEAVAKQTAEINEAFDAIAAACAPYQLASFEKFKKAFNEYLWTRSEFETSVFVVDKSDWMMRQFLDLGHDQLRFLREVGLRHKHMLSQHPANEQLDEP